VRSNIKLQEYVTDEVYFNYNQAILLAIEDVESSMVAYVQESDRYDELTDSVTAASQSVELVMTLYRTGLVDFQNVLDMERSLFEQQDDLVSSEGTKVNNLINIYRALGGGWSSELHVSAAEEEMKAK
jgi:outer membrane protein TolC